MITAKKLTVFLCLLFFSATFSYAQFNHTVGLGINLMTHKIAYTNSEDGAYIRNILRGGVAYFPRYNFVETGKSAISVGAPVSFGLGSVNTGYESGILIAGDAGLGLYYNNGHQATRATEGPFGFFVGAGFSSGFANVFLESDNARLKTYGPMAHIGVRFPMSDANAHIGLLYRHGIEADKYRTYGLVLGIDL